MSGKLLEVQNLTIQFQTEEGVFNAVNNISFDLNKGETLGIVGESGCGKSVTSLALMRLIPSPPGTITNGKILFKGSDLLTKSAKEMRAIRGNDIAMIFQEPMTSLNPVYTIGNQISEVLMLHQKLPRSKAIEKSVELLQLVGIPESKRRVNEYPHQLSGGMRQRVVIAMALACNPELLIADEPTTALDVTIQAQILDLMNEMKEKLNTSIIFITHDLGVISDVADSIMVMYAGEIVERTSASNLFNQPLHPYTQGLIKSVPDVNDDVDYLEPIPGVLPHFSEMPKGCRFSTRCQFATNLCVNEAPELKNIDENHEVRCWMYSERWNKEEGEHKIENSSKALIKN